MSRFEPARFESIKRQCVHLTQAFLDLINAANEQQDARGNARVFVARFLELAADVSEAGHGRDGQIRVAFDERAVGAKAIALKVSGKRRFSIFADQDVIQAMVGPAFVPIE